MDTPIKKRREHYSHAILDAKKNARRKQANERQDNHDSLSTADKLSKAKFRVAHGMGQCLKEIAKLTKKLEWEKAQKVTAQIKKAPMTEIEKSDKAIKRAKAAAAHAQQA